MTKRILCSLTLLLAACSQDQSLATAPAALTPTLGPTDGIYAKEMTRAAAAAAQANTVSPSANAGWAPFTVGRRLGLMKRISVGVDGATFSAIAGFYDKQLNQQCTLMTVGDADYCLPADQVGTEKTVPVFQISTASDCSNPHAAAWANYLVGINYVLTGGHLYQIGQPYSLSSGTVYGKFGDRCVMLVPPQAPTNLPGSALRRELTEGSSADLVDLTNAMESSFAQFQSTITIE